MIGQTSFVASVEAFLVEMSKTTHATTATALGKRVLGDPSFVYRLRRGRDVTLSVAERVTAAMAHYRRHGEYPKQESRGTSPGEAA